MVFAQNLEAAFVSAQKSAFPRNLCALGVSALDFSYSLPFIAPLRSRWSPVALPWETPSISFPFMPLQDFSPSQRGGIPTPRLSPISSPVTKPTGFFSVQRLASSLQPLTRLFPAHPKIAPITRLKSALPKLLDLKRDYILDFTRHFC